MVILNSDDSYGLVTEKVPFIDGAEVTFSQDIPASKMAMLRQLGSGKTEEQEKIIRELFPLVIKDWSFGYKNEKGEEVKMPITAENIEKYCSARLQKWLTEKVVAFLAGSENEPKS